MIAPGRRFFIFLALTIFTLALVLVSCRSAITRPIIFPAPGFKLDPALPGGKIVTAQAERTAYGYYAKAGKKLVVFFHGNGEVMGSMQDVALMMLRSGTSVLMAEYPGYGYAREYTASEANLYADADALLKRVQETYGHSSEDTVLWGFSLGTGVAVEMAARRLGQRLVLMAPLSSVSAAARHHFFFAVGWLVADDFDNKAKAPGIRYPVLIVHGERDSVIPFSMGQELAQLFSDAKLIGVPGADHNDLLEHIDRGNWERIISFATASQ